MGLRERWRGSASPDALTEAERAALAAEGDVSPPTRSLLDLPPGTLAGVLKFDLSVADAAEVAAAAQRIREELGRDNVL